MPIVPVAAAEAIAGLNRFDTIIDARSPSEYALDRLPGARNWPSLDDEQRRIVGTCYKQVSAFEARKIGAAMVARNIAAHIEREVMDKPKDWAPLLYCWRGGQRSGALALVLGQIGFRVHLLEGGYKAWRRHVVRDLETLPSRYTWRVLCGRTGSGKSRLLQALQAQGAQVLDLEALAEHRGSVLGLLPGRPQPSQKQFETRIWQALRTFDPHRVVYVESESRKLGLLQVPLALIESIRQAQCLHIDLALPERIALLMEEYDFFLRDVDALCQQLDHLVPLRGRAKVDGWKQAAREGRFVDLVEALLVQHYDPSYEASLRRNFLRHAEATRLVPASSSAQAYAALARELIANEERH
ncbi:tRNA 2-selenouridine(34) synthase MnmH [Caldimonas sp.]|uniref:tRNA 2-selenouridine(34) synthase MnmH n=1 Tax=Caldimonas sp. TaxID=2838790 RepID=UPI00307D3C1A